MYNTIGQLHWFYAVNCSEDEHYQAQEILILFLEKKKCSQRDKYQFSDYMRTEYSESKNGVNELLGSLSCPKLSHLASIGVEMNATINKKNR